MLKAIFAELISFIKDAVPGLPVSRYKGEFEEGSEWNPVFPSCFIQYSGLKPMEALKLTDGSYQKAFIYVNIFVGDHDYTEPAVLDMVETLQSLFVKSRLTINIDAVDYSFNIFLSEEGTQNFAYTKGAELYRIAVKIEVPYTLIQIANNPPAQITLSAPADGSSDIDGNNADFSWLTGDAEAIDYEIIISSNSDFTDEIFRQDRLKYIKVTVPNDILSSSTEYFWKVRARGLSGSGAWSSSRSFTTGSGAGIIPKDLNDLGFFSWWRADTIETLSGKVTQGTDKTGNGNHLTQTADPQRPVPSDYNGIPSIYYDAAVYKNLNIADTTQKFDLHNEIKSFTVVFVPLLYADTTTMLGRSNPSYGIGWRIARANVQEQNMQFGNANSYNGVRIPILEGKLHKLTVSMNGSNVFTAWLNGVKIATGSAVFFNQLPDGNVNNAFVLGSNYKNNSAGGHFKGHIIECGFSNNELSDSDVESLNAYQLAYCGE